jgi:arylsulfatase A-like enzyme
LTGRRDSVGDSAEPGVRRDAARRRRAAWRAIALLVALVLLDGVVHGDAAPKGLAASSHRGVRRVPPAVNPDATGKLNVLNIVLDDEKDIACDDLSSRYPLSAKWLARGRCFENMSVSDPECCPSRASGMTGQYPHNTGIRRQRDSTRFVAEDSLQHDFQQAGYQTFLVDKLLNGTGTGSDPPFFTRYSTRRDYNYRGFTVREDGEQKTIYQYAPVYFGQLMRNYIAGAINGGKPFYAYFATRTPHVQVNVPDPGPIVQPKYQHAQVPRLDYQPEADTNDKLPMFQHSEGARETEASLVRLNALRERAVLSADEQIAKTFQLLKQMNVLNNTLVMFWSDNGLSLGQNSWVGKGRPYAPSLDVPGIVVPPPHRPRLMRAFPPGTIDYRLASNVDIAPTLLDAAGIAPSHLMDGHSLVGDYERRLQFHEFFHDPSARYEAGNLAATVPSWAEIENGKWAYINYYNDDGSILQHEYYDLQHDPLEEHNLLYSADQTAVSPERVDRLTKKLNQERRCAGTRGNSSNPCT